MANKYKHLSKDRELELGRLIVRRRQAVETLKSLNSNVNNEREQKKLSGKKKNVTEIESQDNLEEYIRIGDLAVAELVEANMGLVYNRALAYKSKLPSAPDVEDLCSMGKIGLMNAVHKYDPDMGNKFSTVAYYWIMQSIGREVNKTARMIRLPENRIADYTRMNAIKTEAEKDPEINVDLDKRFMEDLDLTKIEITNIRNAATHHSSLNYKMGDGEGAQKELIDIVSEEFSEASVDYFVSENECFGILREEVSKLEPQKREIIASHFSLSVNGEYPTAKEVRENRGLSSSKFRRLMTEGLEEIKQALSDRGLSIADFFEV